MHRLMLAMVVVLPTGCSDPGHEQAATTIHVEFAPEDGRTAVNPDFQLEVHLMNDSPDDHGLPPPEVVEEVLASLAVVTWPDLVPVPAHAQARGSPKGIFDVRPAVPLAEGWYAMVLPELPDVEVNHTLLVEPVTGGGHASRFRVGSAIRIARVFCCPSSGLVQLTLSELPEAATRESFHVLADGVACECEYPAAGSHRVDRLSFRCPGEPVDALDVILDEPLPSDAGSILPAGTWHLRMEQADPMGGDCVEWER